MRWDDRSLGGSGDVVDLICWVVRARDRSDEKAEGADSACRVLLVYEAAVKTRKKLWANSQSQIYAERKERGRKRARHRKRDPGRWNSDREGKALKECAQCTAAVYGRGVEGSRPLRLREDEGRGGRE